MKLFKVADFNSKEFGDHFKNNEKYTENPGEILVFCQSGKVGTLLGHTQYLLPSKSYST